MSVHRSQCGGPGNFFKPAEKTSAATRQSQRSFAVQALASHLGEADVLTAQSVALIADADVYFRMAAGAILRRELGFSDVVEVPTFDEANEYLLVHPEVSVAILDLSIPGMRAAMGLRITPRVVPEDKVSRYFDLDVEVRHSLRPGSQSVDGYVPKNLKRCWTDICAPSCP